jgi:phage terminase large subunit-like protein
MIPGALIGGITWKQGVSDLVDTVKVKHVSGRFSLLGFKSYQQGRGSFEGTAQHGAWLDEECPFDIYGEVLIRTATTDGVVLSTFTPIEGYSETVKQFMPRNG